MIGLNAGHYCIPSRLLKSALTLKMPVTELRAAQSWGCSLPGLTTSQTPQSAHRKDEREHGGDAECVKRPDEQEWSAALREFPARCHHVDDRHCQPKQGPDEHDDVP